MAKIVGEVEFNGYFNQKTKAPNHSAVLLAAAELTATKYAEKLDTISQGHRETRYNPTREVIVSKPGDAPNTDTGFLKLRSGAEMQGPNKSAAYSSAEYAEYLELGTAKMAPRPALRPAFNETMEEVEAMFEEAFRKL